MGSILISRISTSLHSAVSALPSASRSTNKWDGGRTKPSLGLVMGTLFVVTLPIEIGFLGVLRGVGWLEIPFLFIGFYVMFFCVTVRLLPFASPCRPTEYHPHPIHFPNFDRSEPRSSSPDSSRTSSGPKDMIRIPMPCRCIPQ